MERQCKKITLNFRDHFESSSGRTQDSNQSREEAPSSCIRVVRRRGKTQRLSLLPASCGDFGRLLKDGDGYHL